MKVAVTLLAILILSLAAPASAQSPGSERSFELRVEGPPGGRRVPLEKHLGDSVIFEEATLDIVATSNGETHRFRPQNRSRPVVKCTLAENQGRVFYTYELLNDIGAEHPVSGFSIPVPEPRKVVASPPARWSVHSAVLGSELSIAFLHLVRDDEEVDAMITAGEIAGPFRLDAERLPGLRLARVHGDQLNSLAPGRAMVNAKASFPRGRGNGSSSSSWRTLNAAGKWYGS